MIDDLGPHLVERGRRYLTRRLRQVDRLAQRAAVPDVLMIAMLDVVDATGASHVSMINLPTATARARAVADAVARVDGVGFLWMYDARVTSIDTRTGARALREGLVAIVQTRDGFVDGLTALYTRSPWTFDRLARMDVTATLIQVPTWPTPSVH